MPRLTAMDEFFVHQIPEPLPNVATFHDHWRESLFFVMHPRDGLGDVVILTLAHFPKRQAMDSLQLGRVGGQPAAAFHERPYDGDPHTMSVGPVHIEITEPFRTVTLEVDDEARAWLAKTGYDPDFGARPLRRLLQKQIEDPLALALLEGRYLEGSTVHVGVKDDAIVLT